MFMRDEDRHEFALTIGTVLINTYRNNIDETTVSLWWNIMHQRMSLQVFQAALAKWMSSPRHGHFAPKPSDIIDIVEGGGSARSLAAWNSVEWAMRHIGRNRSVIFSDRAIHHAIDAMGGWIRLCEKTGVKEDEDRVRQRFMDLYDPVNAGGPEVLFGLLDHPIEPGKKIRPFLIGARDVPSIALEDRQS